MSELTDNHFDWATYILINKWQYENLTVNAVFLKSMEIWINLAEYLTKYHMPHILSLQALYTNSCNQTIVLTKRNN